VPPRLGASALKKCKGEQILTQRRKVAECRGEGLGMHENEISKIILDAATAIVLKKGGKGF
jgi:hypothetical protein